LSDDGSINGRTRAISRQERAITASATEIEIIGVNRLKCFILFYTRTQKGERKKEKNKNKKIIKGNKIKY